MNCRVNTLIIFKGMDELSNNKGVIRRGGDECLEKGNCDMIETLSVMKLIVQIFLNAGS
jgi:hypothetical protein